ncbi:MAG TPA: hypothetical protein VGI19_14545 [Candidatus Cybelea sp.]|jgi:hypothetical protein
MKTTGLLLIALVALTAQSPPPGTAVRHLVYEFGYNTKVASSGNGTGTTAVDFWKASDGGLVVSGTDNWWNTARPRATNTCEVYPNGTVNCGQRPYALSPIQLTLFPLLGRAFFKELSPSGTSSWQQVYEVKAAILPGASGVANALTTWKCTFNLQGKGPIPKAYGAISIASTGTLEQQGSRYLKASSKQSIAYDPKYEIPLIVSDTRTHLPMRSVYSNDLVELKLVKDSGHQPKS